MHARFTPAATCALLWVHAEWDSRLSAPPRDLGASEPRDLARACGRAPLERRDRLALAPRDPARERVHHGLGPAL